ncbi:CRISPR-associated protein, Cse1 family [Oceanospirillum multiglobuliferum]|uniref:Type I-E CRISPR-associated protein Cse1/CasA n=1 Tax=Oceanospirillum multiglobuliferum TaxID=64969 RepID=A0A1T4MLY2_9GAMM|nr:type I-E CRISPR-associated protein Cse1/CasA [Oceanospirillum multiglobuliferum]OPX56963.1 type I-E CRISPR-associated protein Cse1/CasA [Oceanospirillum multiglobuliferum]SJZ68120.1 CRISPR-associated protein, Cse1 family [Oceanospirillum multiglobuliferum]
MDNRFNLIDEPWIPVADFGRVSLKEVFSRPELRALGGNPVQKIALTKLLLAIAQAAATPKDDEHWLQMGWQGMADKCLSYLHQWHDSFYLYGEKPFLQMPEITRAKIRSFGVFSPEVATGNTTVLIESQTEKPLPPEEIAVLLVCQMGFSLGGKKSDNSIIMTEGYRLKLNQKGNPAVGVPGIFIGKRSLGKGKQAGGLLHSFWVGRHIAETLWVNLLSIEDIDSLPNISSIGSPPWECMPKGEDCEISKREKFSYLSHLVPVNKFCFIAEKGIHITDGIVYPDFSIGRIDPMNSVNITREKNTALWVNPQKRPWRELTSILQFVQGDSISGFETVLINKGLRRLKRFGSRFALWSGGVMVTTHTTGEQYAAGLDDYLQSELWLNIDELGTNLLSVLKSEIFELGNIQYQLSKSVERYFHAAGDPKPKDARKITKAKEAKATSENMFWQLCERQAQTLIDACDNSEEGRQQRLQLRKVFASYAYEVFDRTCPNHSARQMDAWAQSRPHFSNYLKAE